MSDWPVVGYYDGSEKPDLGDKVHIDYPNATGPTGYVGRVEEMNGDWEDGDAGGWLYLYPQSDSTLDQYILDNIPSYVQDTIQNLTTGNALGTTPPQTSPATVKVHKFSGQVWKLDTSTKINTGWKWIHPGWSIEFANDDTSVDQTAPTTDISPIFVTDAAKTLADTGSLAMDTPTEEPASGGTLGAWSGLANLKADDSSNATCTLLAGDGSRKLNFTIPASTAIPDTAKITGIEVQYQASASLTDVVYASVTQVRTSNVVDDGYNRVWAVSDNRGYSLEDPLTASTRNFVTGGNLDLWGLEEITADDWNNQNIEVDLQFWNTDASSQTVTMDYVYVKVYYTVNSKHVYFVRDGTDITEGTVFAYQVMDGDWSTNNAQGWYTFDSIDDAGAIQAGDAMWTGTGGTGEFIGNVRAIDMNLLPSHDELRLNGTRSRTKITSLGSTDGNQTAYCVNGVGPAWAIDADDRIRMIRTPVARENDKPRYVEEHRDHLLLGLKEHLIVSSIARPDNMSTYDGATTWHIKDRITGMHHTTDGTTVILCKDSIHQFQGAAASGNDPFALTTITNRGGAKDYSSIEMGEIYFLTPNGISTVGATRKFGNFDSASMSGGVSEWLRERLILNNDATGEVPDRGFLDAIPVKAKNQLRFFFKDGWILTATLPRADQQDPAFTFQHYGLFWNVSTGTEGTAGYQPFDTPWDFSPSALHSSFTSWGEERLFMAKESSTNEVMRIDVGSFAYIGLDVLSRYQIASYAELNPVMFGSPYDGPSQLERTDFIFDCPARPLVCVNTGTDFKPPLRLDSTAAAAEPYMVSQEPQFTYEDYTGGRLTFMTTSHIGNYAHAHSWVIMSHSEAAAINKPVRFISFTPHTQPRKRSARAQTEVINGTALPRSQ